MFVRFSHAPAAFCRRAAFTLVELMVTVSIVALTSSAAMVLSARCFNLLKAANDSTLATQCLQERIEQFRGLSWSSLTSEEVPGVDEDDTVEDSDDSVGDLTTEVLTEPTEFPDDLGDLQTNSPGLYDTMSAALVSATDLRDVVETVTVAKYPDGSNPIKVRREADGSVTIISHNADLVYEDMVRVVLQFSWKSKADGRTKTVAAQTIITKNTQ